VPCIGSDTRLKYVLESPRLTREQILSVYRQVLGREPDGGEIAAQLAALPDLDAMLRVALDSEEYAQRLAEAGNLSTRTPTEVNIYHPDLAGFGPRPGTRSPDDSAIVGDGGQLLLRGGSNAVLGQYTGEVRMAPGWLDSWRDLILARRAETAALGVSTALLVVPDKLAVYEDRYPEPLRRQGLRPAEQLHSEPGLDVLYPLAELQAAAAAGEDVYLRTDTHLTFRGNELLFAAVAPSLGVEAPDFSDLPMNSYPITGDLGSKFDPPIVSIVNEPGTLAAAKIVEDNRPEIEAVGGHIGTRRVFYNGSSPDPRTAVLFGDSFGFSAPNYQGISWFMAQVFRETHFVWIPFGWDPDYVRRIGAEVALVQGAERFVARIPHPRTEVAELAAETLRRKQPVGVEAVSDG
jgi:alginate O-acetyltransferase complex protein AlgJ